MDEPTNLDLAALRESVDLEARADLFAVACNFEEASWLMSKANGIRRRVFGKWSPNELRDLTNSALAKVSTTPLMGSGDE